MDLHFAVDRDAHVAAADHQPIVVELLADLQPCEAVQVGADPIRAENDPFLVPAVAHQHGDLRRPRSPQLTTRAGVVGTFDQTGGGINRSKQRSMKERNPATVWA